MIDLDAAPLPFDQADLEPADPDEDAGDFGVSVLVSDPPETWTAAGQQPVEFSLRPSA